MTVPRQAEETDDPLKALLAGRYRDPTDGMPVFVKTRSLVIAETIAGMEAELIAGLGFGRKLAVVSDQTTHGVLGAQIERALTGAHEVTSLVLPEHPHADEANVEKLRGASAGVDAFVAVGSGTINDLTKYLSAREGKPYAVFGTAPSMNGYVSLTASITLHGHKMTLPAQAPAGAFFDLGVLAAAPKRMIRAGLGDSVCRTTAQADWLLSHLLLGTDYRALPFLLLEGDEADLLEQAKPLLNGDIEAMRTLARTLMLSGFGTAIVGSSAPASQGEHLVSHFIDMREPPRPEVLHGEQIAVTTLSLARLQRAMLDAAPVVRADTETEASVKARFGKDLADSVWEEFSHKRLDAAGADALNHKIATRWGDIRQKLEAVLLPIGRLEAVLNAASAPMRPADIHLERSFYESALMHGREIRNRFTMLDLAAASGRLTPMLASL